MATATKLPPKSAALVLPSIFAALMVPMPTKATSCFTGPFIIFFESNSDELDAQDRGVLNRVVEIANKGCSPNGQVMVAGFADTASDKKHLRISDKRAKAVTAYFRAMGIKKSRLMSDGFGDTHPLISTPTDVGEPQNRRVEISIRPPKE